MGTLIINSKIRDLYSIHSELIYGKYKETLNYDKMEEYKIIDAEKDGILFKGGYLINRDNFGACPIQVGSYHAFRGAKPEFIIYNRKKRTEFDINKYELGDGTYINILFPKYWSFLSVYLNFNVIMKDDIIFRKTGYTQNN